MAASPQIIKKASPRPPVISTAAKRSGEISPSDGTSGITVGDLSTQSIIKAFSLCPIPTRSPARDDSDGGQHWTHLRCEGSKGSEGGGSALRAQITKKPARTLPSFRPQRSGVEKSHSTMVHEAMRQEISRLSVSWERFPSVSHSGTYLRSR